MGRDGRMGNDEQWMRLALAVLKRAEADYKISTIRLRQSKRYTADNIATKLHQEFTTPMMGLLCPRGIEETLASWDKKYGGAGSYVDGSRRGAHLIRVMQDYYG